MQYFIHQTPAEIRIGKVTDFEAGKMNAQLNGFRLQAGSIETWETNEDMFSKSFVDKLLKKGYLSITETEYLEYLKKAPSMLLSKTQEPQNETYTILPWETIETRFAPGFLNDVNEYLTHPGLRDFCLYPGDTVIDGDLIINFSELASTSQTETRNIIVNGNLTIKGNFDGGRDIEALPQFIYITGNLMANNLLLSGWLEMIVEGDVIITDTVLGYYGESGGRLLVKGNLKATHLLNGFMYPFYVGGAIIGTAYTFDAAGSGDGYNAQKIKDSFTPKEELADSPLIAVVIPYDKDMKEYAFRFEEACTQIRKGESIFK